MKIFTCALINKLKKKDVTTKVIRFDNAGENKSLEKVKYGKDYQMAIHFEHTARATPQQNSPVETGLSYTLNKAKAMMIDANMQCLVRHNIVQEAIITLTKHDGLEIITIKGKKHTRHGHF